MASRRAKTERRILEAARELFVRYGYDKTTVDDVAREAGVAKATVYRYWCSKEALFGTLLYRELRAVNRDFLARVEADPAGGTIGRIVYHGYAASYERPFLRALMTTESRTLGQYLRRHSAELARWQFRFDRQLVEALQEAGVFRRDLEPGLLTYLLSTVSLGLTSAAEFIPPEFTPPPEILTKALADMAQRAFAPPDGGDSARGKAVLRAFLESLDASLEELERSIRGGRTEGAGG